MRQTRTVVAQERRTRGQSANFAGRSAESAARRWYEAAGHAILADRWRGGGGEIDLIARDGAQYVFVEVKTSRSFDAAMAALTPAQMARIHAAASAYLAHTPEGQLAEVRFDLALMDGTGALRVIRDAFGHF